MSLAEDLLNDPRGMSLADLESRVTRGIPARELRGLAPRRLKWDEVASVVGPRRTLERRLGQDQNLTVEEGDKLVRLSRIIGLAVSVFGEEDEALEWLRAPKRQFAGQSPLAMLRTEAGARRVEELLEQARWGMLA